MLQPTTYSIITSFTKNDTVSAVLAAAANLRAVLYCPRRVLRLFFAVWKFENNIVFNDLSKEQESMEYGSL
jgi:hypothetical protein